MHFYPDWVSIQWGEGFHFNNETQTFSQDSLVINVRLACFRTPKSCFQVNFTDSQTILDNPWVQTCHISLTELLSASIIAPGPLWMGFWAQSVACNGLPAAKLIFLPIQYQYRFFWGLGYPRVLVQSQMAGDRKCFKAPDVL